MQWGFPLSPRHLQQFKGVGPGVRKVGEQAMHLTGAALGRMRLVPPLDSTVELIAKDRSAIPEVMRAGELGQPLAECSTWDFLCTSSEQHTGVGSGGMGAGELAYVPK